MAPLPTRHALSCRVIGLIIHSRSLAGAAPLLTLLWSLVGQIRQQPALRCPALPSTTRPEDHEVHQMDEADEKVGRFPLPELPGVVDSYGLLGDTQCHAATWPCGEVEVMLGIPSLGDPCCRFTCTYPGLGPSGRIVGSGSAPNLIHVSRCTTPRLSCCISAGRLFRQCGRSFDFFEFRPSTGSLPLLGVLSFSPLARASPDGALSFPSLPFPIAVHKT